MTNQTFRIELTTSNGQLYHSSTVATEKVKDTHSIVSKDADGVERHFGFSRLQVGPFRATLHFQEVTPPVVLEDLLKGH
jgi:hypothetical protein